LIHLGDASRDDGLMSICANDDALHPERRFESTSP